MRDFGSQILHAAFIVTFSTGIAFAGPTAAEKCESAKNKAAGKYALCRGKAEAKAIRKGTAPEYTKCDSKLDKRWTKAELKAACLDTVSAAAIRDFVTAGTDTIATALASAGALPECGDGEVNAVGEQCDGADLAGTSCNDLGHLAGALACDGTCGFDATGCNSCASFGGVKQGGSCWFLATATDCNAACAAAGLSYSAATATYAGDGGTLAHCYAVMDALGQTSPPFGDVGDTDCLGNGSIAVSGLGCVVTGPGFPLRLRCTSTPTNASASHPDIARACACE